MGYEACKNNTFLSRGCRRDASSHRDEFRTAGPGENFSIDNGTTLLKLYNNALVNSLDTRDWAPGTNDSFNQFSDSGVTNPVSDVDLREMDVIGYDLAAPEPSEMLPVAGLLGLLFVKLRRRS